MKTYRIEIAETVIYYLDIKAETRDAALRRYHEHGDPDRDRFESDQPVDTRVTGIEEIDDE